MMSNLKFQAEIGIHDHRVTRYNLFKQPIVIGKVYPLLPYENKKLDEKGNVIWNATGKFCPRCYWFVKDPDKDEEKPQ